MPSPRLGGHSRLKQGYIKKSCYSGCSVEAGLQELSLQRDARAGPSQPSQQTPMLQALFWALGTVEDGGK